MYSTYVLHSSKYGKIYIGQSNDTQRRLYFHNHGPKKGWTAQFRPWELIYEEEYPTRSEAIEREKQLKSARGRKWIWEELVGSEE